MLVQCRECEHRVSTEADNCPKCGCPQPWERPEDLAKEKSVSRPAEKRAAKKDKTEGNWFNPGLAVIGAMMAYRVFSQGCNKKKKK